MSTAIEQDLESVSLDDAVVDPAAGVETPATETPAPATEAPAPEGAPPAEADPAKAPAEPADTVVGGVRVDKLGRMHRADGTVMSRAEVEASRAPKVEAATPTPAPKNAPWVPTANGRPTADLLPGALRSPKGDLFVPSTQAGTLEKLVARGLRYDEFRERADTAVARAEHLTKRTAAEAKALETTLLSHVASPDALQALVERVQAVGPELAHLELKLAIQQAAQQIDREFGGSQPARTTEPGNTTPIDRDDASETFEEYWRDMLAKPEYHGMSPDLQQHARQLLAQTNLFVTKNGEWFLHEATADPVWAMVKATLDRERQIAAATTANTARRPAPANTTPARLPPSVSGAAPLGTGTRRTTTKPKREFANPWDAVRYADITED